MLEVQGLSVKINGYKILEDVSFKVDNNQWLMVVGPNGAGKSTIINAIVQSIPYKGNISYNGKDVSKFKSNEFAKKIGVLMQSNLVNYGFSVEEVVKLGRYAYSSSLFGRTSDLDDKKIRIAMEVTGISSFKDKSVLTLSGGELQRTFLAQLLAQDPQLLLLDEPTNHLDLVYQKQVFSIVEEWIKKTGNSVISVVHDLSLARAYGTHAVLLKEGKVISKGETDEVLNKNNLYKAYSMDVPQWMHKMLSQWEESDNNIGLYCMG